MSIIKLVEKFPALYIKRIRYSGYSTVRSESRCALTEGVGSDVHERLYRPETV
jgi:hypothetical protein